MNDDSSSSVNELAGQRGEEHSEHDTLAWQFDLEYYCNAFEKDWTGDQPPGHAVAKATSGISGPPKRELVRELVACDLELRGRQGDFPDRSDYHASLPQFTAEVDAAFDWFLVDARSDDANCQRGVPERLGDYRIVREIGRGGMGVVYEAVQESLNRRAAIKALAALPVTCPKMPAGLPGKSSQPVRCITPTSWKSSATEVMPVFTTSPCSLSKGKAWQRGFVRRGR